MECVPGSKLQRFLPHFWESSSFPVHPCWSRHTWLHMCLHVCAGPRGPALKGPYRAEEEGWRKRGLWEASTKRHTHGALLCTAVRGNIITLKNSGESVDARHSRPSSTSDWCAKFWLHNNCREGAVNDGGGRGVDGAVCLWPLLFLKDSAALSND